MVTIIVSFLCVGFVLGLSTISIFLFMSLIQKWSLWLFGRIEQHNVPHCTLLHVIQPLGTYIFGHNGTR